MTAIRRAYFEAGPGQVHARLAGPEDEPVARPLICLHMTPKSGWVYESLLRELGRDRLAVALDTPGYGASDPPVEPPSIADYAGWLLEAIEAVAPAGPVDLLGYHTGAVIAVELAVRAPERIGRVAMVSAPLYTGPELEARRRKLLPPGPDPRGHRLAAAYRRFRSWQMPGLTEAYLAQSWAEHQRTSVGVSWAYRAVFDYPLAERLPLVEKSLLVLRPQDDLWRQTARARRLLPAKGRLLDLPGWSHGMFELHGAALAALLREFLDTSAPSEVDRVPTARQGSVR